MAAEKVITPEQLKYEAQSRNLQLYDALRNELPLSARIAAEPSELCTGIVQLLYAAQQVMLTQAQEVMAAKKLGCKGHADGLRNAAARINALGLGMHTHGLPEVPDSELMAAGGMSIKGPATIVTETPEQPSRGVIADAVKVAQDLMPKLERQMAGDWTAPIDTITQPDADGVISAIWSETAQQGPKRCQHGGIWHDLTPACPQVTLIAGDPGGVSVGPFHIGDKVEVSGMTFTKIGEDPFGQPGVNPFSSPPAIPANPFGFAQPKAPWNPDLPVFALEDPPETWALPSPDHTSPSQAETAAGCGMKWWLKYRRGAHGRPSWAALGGSALHKVIEWIEKGRMGDNPSNAPELVRAWWATAFREQIAGTETSSPFPKHTWHASKQGKEDEAWWNADGPEMVHRYLEWRAKWMAQGWAPHRLLETPVIELEILGEDGVLQIIDSAWENSATGQVMLIDWKSGATKPADYFQLASNARALCQRAGWPNLVRHGAFWDARSGELGPVVDLRERHTDAELDLRLQAPRKMDAAGLYMPNVNGGYGGCNSCSYKLSCPVGSRIGKGETSAEPPF